MLSNKKINPIIIELFIIERKLNISLAFITQSYFAVLKNIRLNLTHYFIMKIPSKHELQQITFNDLTSETLWKCTAETFYFLVTDATLSSGNPSCFN